MSDLELLLEKVRTAEAGSPDLDDAIHAALFLDHEFAQLKDAPEGTGCMMYRRSDGVQSSALRITTSIDAIVALIERELPDHMRRVQDSEDGGGAYATLVLTDGTIARNFGANWPLALCAAFLSAKIQTGSGETGE